MPKKSTRQKILDLLSNQDHLSAAELSRALSLTQADVRYHLSKMMKEGLVIPIKPTHSGRRGRPGQRFTLISKTKQSNFELLTKALLLSLRETLPEPEEHPIFTAIARQIVEETIPEGPLGKRLVRAVDQLNLLHYQARWEAHLDAPLVIFDRCPFAALRPEFPELCILDTNLLEIMLHEGISQVSAEAYLPDGNCTFNISQEKTRG